MRAAPLAALALLSTCAATSMRLSFLPLLEHDQVIPVDDLVESLVAENLFNLPGLRAANLSELVGVVVDKAACELRPGLRQGHDRARAEFPVDLREPRGKQALAPFS